MKHAALLVLLFSFGLVACSNDPPTPSVGDIQTAIAQTQVHVLIPTIEPTRTPIPIDPTQTPASVNKPTSMPVREPTNIATVIADTSPHFKYAMLSGVAHMENGYFLVTLEVPGGVEGEYYGLIGEEEFDCVTLSEYPNRLYCTGITSQAGALATLKIFEQGENEPVYEDEIGIPPLPATDSIQARIERDERAGSDDDPPVDSIPNPYPYPYP